MIVIRPVIAGDGDEGWRLLMIVPLTAWQQARRRWQPAFTIWRWAGELEANKEGWTEGGSDGKVEGKKEDHREKRTECSRSAFEGERECKCIEKEAQKVEEKNEVGICACSRLRGEMAEKHCDIPLPCSSESSLSLAVPRPEGREEGPLYGVDVSLLARVLLSEAGLGTLRARREMVKIRGLAGEGGVKEEGGQRRQRQRAEGGWRGFSPCGPRCLMAAISSPEGGRKRFPEDRLHFPKRGYHLLSVCQRGDDRDKAGDRKEHPDPPCCRLSTCPRLVNKVPVAMIAWPSNSRLISSCGRERSSVIEFTPDRLLMLYIGDNAPPKPSLTSSVSASV
ncbi:Chalcone--flavonone isomerase, partial [Dissostichus eleginoides]